MGLFRDPHPFMGFSSAITARGPKDSVWLQKECHVVEYREQSWSCTVPGRIRGSGKDMLALSSYALEVLLVSWLGVALIFLAFVLLVVDLSVTNHGLPTIGGLVVLVLGVLLLFDVTGPYLWVLLVAFAVVAILIGVLFVGVLREVFAAGGRPVETGIEGMIGEVGVVKEPVGAGLPGWVFVHGEWWQAVVATAPEEAHKQDREQVIGLGRKVQVVDVRDGKVVVVPFEPATLEHPPES
jgi:membrane-bound ClpP family serine protease